MHSTITEEEHKLFQAEMHKQGVVSIHQQSPPPPKPAKITSTPPPKRRAILTQPQTQSFSPLPQVSSEDFLEFRRPGLQNRVMQKLRRGDFPMEAVLDLHGYTVMQAEQMLEQFLLHARTHSWHSVLIVHGKGKTTRGESTLPILKNRVNQWLREDPNVLGFCSAKQSHGGVGAVYVLLRKS